MKIVLKVGSNYVTSNGSLSGSQADAMKIETALRAHHADVRAVVLRPRGSVSSAPSSDSFDALDSDGDALTLDSKDVTTTVANGVTTVTTVTRYTRD